MYRLTANSVVPLRKSKSVDEDLITGSRLTTDTELELNHYIQGGSTVGLSANTEFGLNRSIHGHSTDDSQQNYEVPLSQFNLQHHLTNPNLASSPGHHDPRLMTAFPLSPLSVRNTNVEVDSDSDCPNISKIEPTYAEAEALSRQLQTIKIDDLEQILELGSGTYGVVYHGKWRGSDVAVKRIKLSSFAEIPSKRERLIADFWKEAMILNSLRHPNVVAFYGIVCDGPDGSLAAVTEFMINGSLKQFLQKKIW